MKAFIPKTFYFLVALLFLSCTNESDPNVKSVQYNSTSGDISISLEDINKEDKAVVISRIKIKKGAFTGQNITFDISADPAAPWESKNYKLHSFSEALTSNTVYFIIMQKGAFNNAGTSLVGAQFDDGKSDGGVYQLFIE